MVRYVTDYRHFVRRNFFKLVIFSSPNERIRNSNFFRECQNFLKFILSIKISSWRPDATHTSPHFFPPSSINMDSVAQRSFDEDDAGELFKKEKWNDGSKKKSEDVTLALKKIIRNIEERLEFVQLTLTSIKTITAKWSQICVSLALFIHQNLCSLGIHNEVSRHRKNYIERITSKRKR